MTAAQMRGGHVPVGRAGANQHAIMPPNLPKVTDEPLLGVLKPAQWSFRTNPVREKIAMNLRLVELATFLWGHMLFGAVLACMAAAARFWLASAALWRGGGAHAASLRDGPRCPGE